MTPSRKKFWQMVMVLALALAGWMAFDIFCPHTSRLREFDPDEIARLETAMWQSYYARQRVRLFCLLGETLQSQYNMPFWRAQWTALQAARAAFVFKKGKSRAAYEQALPSLRRGYATMHASSDIDFAVERVARLELEWWIIHRERKEQSPQSLENALAAHQAEVYRVASAVVAEHARLRAAAMHIRDTKAAAGGVTADDWQQIAQLLRDSWRALHDAVNGRAVAQPQPDR